MPARLVFDSRRRQSSAMASRTGGCSVFRNERGTRSRSEEPSERRPYETCCGWGMDGESGIEVARVGEPNSDDDEEDCVNGEASRKNSSPLSDSVE